MNKGLVSIRAKFLFENVGSLVVHFFITRLICHSGIHWVVRESLRVNVRVFFPALFWWYSTWQLHIAEKTALHIREFHKTSGTLIEHT